MSSSETTGRGWRAFLRAKGLDDDWTVRFTAEEGRAREMAGQYRDAGYEVRVLPLFPEAGEPTAASLKRLEGADYDPLRDVEDAACAPCLQDTFVLLTRRDGSGDGAEGLVYR